VAACKDKCPQPLGHSSSCLHCNSQFSIFSLFHFHTHQYFYFQVSKRDPETLIKATCLLTFYYPPTHHNTTQHSLLLSLSLFFFFFFFQWVSHPVHTAGSLLNLPQPATSASSFPFITLVTRNGFIPLFLLFLLSSVFPSSNLCFTPSLSHPWMKLSLTPRLASRPSFPTSFTRPGANRSSPVRPGLRAATRRTSSPG